MYARVTLLEIDPVRIDPAQAVELFKEQVLPELVEQEGYEGVFVLSTPEGRGLLMSLWSTREAAEAGETSGFYGEQLAKFVTFFRASPGREQYEVAFADAPSLAAR